MNKQTELLNDYVKRWGNAQKCSSCGYVMPYGPFDKIHKCCGKPMELVKEDK
jgi:predicted PolB exonuclease-like 3'-5' exonuclease